MNEIKFDLRADKSKAIGLRLPYDLLDDIERLATELGTTPPKLIRQLIYQRIYGNGQDADNPDRGA